MKIAELAKKLVEMRTATATSYIAQAKLVEELGTDGYAEALNQGWIVPDLEVSGMVHLTQDGTAIHKMESLAESCIKDGEDQCDDDDASEEGEDVEESLGRNLALEHSKREKPTLAENSLMVMGPAVTKPDDKGLDVGSSVVCTENGKSYRAKVSQKLPNGKLKLSFGEKRPSDVDREFDPSELGVADSGDDDA